MKDQSKTKQILTQELVSLRERITELEQSEPERKRVESQQQQVSLKTLVKSESLMRAITDSAQDAILMMDPTGCISFWNPGAEHIFGYTSKEAIGQDLHQFLAPELYREAHHAAFSKFKKTGQGEALDKTNELQACRKNGEEFPIELSLSAIYLEDGWHALGIIRDITERKQAAEALKESEKKYRLLADHVNDVIFVLDMNLNYTYVSPSIKTMRGYEPEEVLKQLSIETLTPSSRDLTMRTLSEVMELEKSEHRDINISQTLQLEMVRKDGTTLWTEVKLSFIRDENQRPVGILGVTRDITERKEVNRKLQEAAIFQQRLIDALPVPVFYKDSEGRYLGCNSSFEKFFGKKREQVTGKSVYELSPKEFADIYHEKDLALLQNPGIQIYESEVKDAGGVAHNVIFHKATFSNMDGSVGGLIGGILDITDRKRAEEARRDSEGRLNTLVQTIPDLIWLKDKDGVYLSCNTMFERFFGAREADIVGKTDYDFVDRELADSFREHDNNSMAAGKTTSNEEWITFADDGHRVFLDTIKTPMYDARGTLIGVLGIGRDITDRRAVERIRKALGATIQAIAVTVETRDPYTAGHQLRVADLARAIATEMHLPIDIIEGIRMAAAIHDLGKISVPAEILSKPTKLKKTEFDLIKEHSQSGYDILKDIDFPWPVARIVLEHHERMNGSGYPNGLAGDNILMESRIMAVADVVESMGSHRPYRPSLGIEAALEEIEKNKGTFYDNAVADACMRLFREKGYQLQ